MLKQIKKVLTYELPIKIEKQQAGGFVATSPVWQDAYAQGDTLEEAVLEITAVAQSLIELYNEEGFEIPLKKQKIQRSTKDQLTVPIIVAA